MDALIVVFVTGLISMFIAMAKKPLLVFLTAFIGLSIALVLELNQLQHPQSSFVKFEGLMVDQVTVLYSSLALLFTLLILSAGFDYFRKEEEHTGEYISLILFSLVGALCMIGFSDFFMFFLGLEILSIPIYVLVGTKKKNILSTEASLKYFFTGAFATGIFLFGMAWVYGATGTFKLSEIMAIISRGGAQGPLLYVGLLMMMASFLFKVGAVPFHFWSPDVYEGSPTAVTGYMATVVKLAGLLAFMKLFTFTFAGLHYVWGDALAIVIVLTLLVGNLSALRQTKFKRLLAYSSIANAGYALIAVLVQEYLSVWNLFTYLVGYGLASIALITVALMVNDETDELATYKGIGRKYPLVGFVMAIALFSLVGLPPLAGFFGKFVVLSTAYSYYPWLVYTAIAMSGIGVYYYLKFLITVFTKEENEEAVKINPTSLQIIVVAICLAGLMITGFFVA